jgi:hypothetical protein
MLPKGLAKAKSLARPRVGTMDLGIWFATTLEFIWNSCKNSLVESLRSKRSRKCSKTIREKPLIQRCSNQMKVDLKKYKEKIQVQILLGML